MDIYARIGMLPIPLIMCIIIVFLFIAGIILYAIYCPKVKKTTEEKLSSYLPALDGLRAVSVILIFIFHLWQQTWISYKLRLTDTFWLFNFEPFQRYGYVVLDAFFMLSGFCMFYPVARAMFGECKEENVITFYRKRARRILPSYLLILLIIFLLPEAGQVVSADMPFIEKAKHYLMHIFFVHNFSSDTVMSIVPTAWTMAIEVQFYLIFPLLKLLFKKNVYLTFFGMAAVGVITRLILLSYADIDQFAQANTLGYFDIFAIGMLASYILVMMRHKNIDWTKLRIPMTVLALVCLVGAYQFMVFMGRTNLGENIDSSAYVRFCWRFIPGIFFAVFVIAATYSVKFFGKTICGNKFFVFISGISYNFYLVQQNVNIFLKKVGVPYTTASPVMNDRQAMEGFSLIAIVICIVYSVLVTKYIEKPISAGGIRGILNKKDKS